MKVINALIPLASSAFNHDLERADVLAEEVAEELGFTIIGEEFTEIGHWRSIAFLVPNARDLEAGVQAIQQRLQPIFAPVLVLSEETTSGAEEAGDEIDMVRARHIMAGAQTLAQAAESLIAFAQHLRALECAGWRLADTVHDDYLPIRRPARPRLTHVGG